MRRTLSILLILVLVLSSIPVVFAANHMSAGAQLKVLGLIEGNLEGDLMEDKTFTRAELAVMLARLNGVENEAIAFNIIPPFNDVEGHWAAAYISYAEEEEWMIGVGDNQFNPNSLVSEQMVATTMLRVLGYDPEWPTAIAEAEAVGIIDDVGGNFVRANAFDMMFDTVNTEIKGSYITLGQKLGVLAMQGSVAIDSAVAINATVLEVSLDEGVEAPVMINASIFAVMDDSNTALSIEAVEFAPWDADQYTVLVTLEEVVEAGEAYTIMSGSSEVNFGGTIPDLDEPIVEDVNTNDYNKVEVVFNEAVRIDDLTVDINESYGTKDELEVLDYSYDGSGTILVTTEAQADATLYDVTVSGAVDLAGNEMATDDSYTFSGQSMDTDEQEVISATIKDSLTIEVTFRTKVDVATAVAVTNYTVTESYGTQDSIDVIDAAMKLDADDQVVEEVVVLTLGEHTKEATLYNLTVEDVNTLYGIGMDLDNNSDTFNGVAQDTEAPDDISVTVISNTEVLVTVTDGSDLSENIDASLFTIAESYGTNDELSVIAVKDIDVEVGEITLTTASQNEATLYELTVAEGLADKFGNVTDEVLTDTFSGLGVADEITEITATNTADKKVRVDFDKNYGSGALNVTNYLIDGGIGYPTQVKAIDNDDNSVLLTVSKLEVGKVYELTVEDVRNADGVAMDPEGLTDTFSGKFGSTTTQLILESVIATDDQTLELTFNKDVDDITGLVDSNHEIEKDAGLANDALQYRYEGDANYNDLVAYAYESSENPKVLIVQTNINGAFNNTNAGEDELYLKVDPEDVVNIDTDASGNIVKFAENTNDISDITVEGVIALDSSTLEVYFNQGVRDMTVSNGGVLNDTFAFVDLDADDSYDAGEGFVDAYATNDAMTEWTFVMATQMAASNPAILEFVIEDENKIDVHTGGTIMPDIVFSADSADQTVEFSKNTTSVDYMDDIDVTMLDSKTVTVVFPEAMDLTDNSNDSVLDLNSSDVFDFDIDADAVDEDPTNADEDNITQVVWDSSNNSATLTLNEAFGTIDGSNLYLGFATTLANKANTKTVKTENGNKLWQEFSVSTAAAEEIGIEDVSANINNATPNAGEIVVTLNQSITSGTYGTIGDFLTDFEVKINGEELIVSDVATFNASYFVNDPNIDDTKVLNPLSLSKFELILDNVYIGANAAEIMDNDTVEVEITSNSQNIVATFNGEGLDIGATSAATVDDMNTDTGVNGTDLTNIQGMITFDDANGGFDLVNGLGALNEETVKLEIAVVGNTATASDGTVDHTIGFTHDYTIGATNHFDSASYTKATQDAYIRLVDPVGNVSSWVEVDAD